MNLELAKKEAKRIASEAQEKCYIAESEIYAYSDDEFTDGPYVVGTAAVFATMYSRLVQFGGKLVAVTDPDGTYFCNDLELLMKKLDAAIG